MHVHIHAHKHMCVCMYKCTAFKYHYPISTAKTQCAHRHMTPYRSSKEAYRSGCSVGWLHGCLNKASFPSPLRYEEEVALRATAENEFVALKKVSD